MLTVNETCNVVMTTVFTLFSGFLTWKMYHEERRIQRSQETGNSESY